ncbi:L,D-transpeptidase family protein [Pedobacter sp. L105]|uniref:L,D-transpeptidase family protein n=1 Tax=Pedobacter sp. L105 TaxID=1641871 RepID=UPI0020B15C47|nr:L,D-transpeptidase family protein [Pedobacter sp. L105]
MGVAKDMVKKLFAGKLVTTVIVVFIMGVLLMLQGCHKSKSDLGNTLFTETGNKVFKKIDNDAFAEVFKKELAYHQNLGYPGLTAAFYEQNGYEPVMILKNIHNKGMQLLFSYFNKAGEHGLDPGFFRAQEFGALINKLYDKNGIKTVNEAYHTLARLELLTANSLISYSNALQYGVVSPKSIYTAYYTDTKRPDSLAMIHIFDLTDFRQYLDSIQPKDLQYIALQKALKEGTAAPGISVEETQKVLKINLERLRWKNKPLDEKYVIVNIADYRLDVMEAGKSVLNMKVCVGEGRAKAGSFSRETPQLNSLIHSVQVNPVWNIPQSIASNEITKEAAADKYYLSSHNIDVYEKGQLVEDTELIDWSDAGAGKKYQFKQRPGADNSLGKIKFLFNNKSAVYLHDTPAKAAFSQSMRAVSHGCVRLEKPLDLAHALFGDGTEFEQIKKQMDSTADDTAAAVATNIALPKKVPVYLTYYTSWVDDGNILQVRKDVYGLDRILYTYLQKIGAV